MSRCFKGIETLLGACGNIIFLCVNSYEEPRNTRNTRKRSRGMLRPQSERQNDRGKMMKTSSASFCPSSFCLFRYHSVFVYFVVRSLFALIKMLRHGPQLAAAFGADIENQKTIPGDGGEDQHGPEENERVFHISSVRCQVSGAKCQVSNRRDKFRKIKVKIKNPPLPAARVHQPSDSWVSFPEATRQSFRERRAQMRRRLMLRD